MISFYMIADTYVTENDPMERLGENDHKLLKTSYVSQTPFLIKLAKKKITRKVCSLKKSVSCKFSVCRKFSLTIIDNSFLCLAE